jgi:hypothetical protein
MARMSRLPPTTALTSWAPWTLRLRRIARGRACSIPRVLAERCRSGADLFLSRVPHGLPGDHPCLQRADISLHGGWRLFPEIRWQ